LLREPLKQRARGTESTSLSYTTVNFLSLAMTDDPGTREYGAGHLTRHQWLFPPT
jgi:hypothetical protein